jgi:hypothetical protein
MSIEQSGLGGEFVAVRERVPQIGVPGDQPQHARAAAGQQHRHAAADPVEHGAHLPEALAGCAERDAVLLELPLAEPGAEPEQEPAAADLVDGPGHRGDQAGVAVSGAADQRADPHP